MFRSNKFSVIATALAVCSSSAFAADVSVPAASGWVDSGIDVSSGKRLDITAAGTWSNGGASPQWVGADGWPSVLLTNTQLPQAPLSSLVGRIGSQTFLIGSKYRASTPAPGRLFLSINDTQGDFTDNQGAIKASVSVLEPIDRGIDRISDTEHKTLSANELLPLARLALAGGRVQLSQTDAGVERTIQVNGVPRKTRSFLVFGPALADMEIPIDLPVKEYSVDQLLGHDTGGVSILAQYVVTHSAVFIDNARLLVNNVRANFDDDVNVRLADGEVLLEVSLHSDDPALRGEGNGYSGIPFGIPYPLGWQDGLCPDVTFDNMKIIIHLAPSLDAASGQLHLQNPTVKLDGGLALTVGDFLIESHKEELGRQVEQQLQDQLSREPARTAIEKMLTALLLQGRPNANVTGVTIDASGIDVAFKKAT